MGHFVADDDADAAKVDGRIDGEVEEGRLQNAGREVDVVQRRIVVGVDSGRRHAPLLLVHWLAQVSEVPVARKHAIAAQVADQVVALHIEGRVAAPLLGIADLVADHVQLFFGGLLGVVAHPGQGLDVFAERLFESWGGKFCLTQSCPTASPRARSVMLVHCFQRGVGSF